MPISDLHLHKATLTGQFSTSHDRFYNKIMAQLVSATAVVFHSN
jgi:hypothetical protein